MKIPAKRNIPHKKWDELTVWFIQRLQEKHSNLLNPEDDESWTELAVFLIPYSRFNFGYTLKDVVVDESMPLSIRARAVIPLYLPVYGDLHQEHFPLWMGRWPGNTRLEFDNDEYMEIFRGLDPSLQHFVVDMTIDFTRLYEKVGNHCFFKDCIERINRLGACALCSMEQKKRLALAYPITIKDAHDCPYFDNLDHIFFVDRQTKWMTLSWKRSVLAKAHRAVRKFLTSDPDDGIRFARQFFRCMENSMIHGNLPPQIVAGELRFLLTLPNDVIAETLFMHRLKEFLRILRRKKFKKLREDLVRRFASETTQTLSREDILCLETEFGSFDWFVAWKESQEKALHEKELQEAQQKEERGKRREKEAIEEERARVDTEKRFLACLKKIRRTD